MPSPLSVGLSERVVPSWWRVSLAIAPQPASGSACRVPAGGRSASATRANSPPSRWLAITPSKLIEAHAGLILRISEQEPRLFLREVREVRDRLAEHGVQNSMSGLSRIFAHHGIS